MMPASIRTQPTTCRSSQPTDTSTANAMMAPTAMRKMLPPIPTVHSFRVPREGHVTHIHSARRGPPRSTRPGSPAKPPPASQNTNWCPPRRIYGAGTRQGVLRRGGLSGRTSTGEGAHLQFGELLLVALLAGHRADGGEQEAERDRDEA